MYGQVIGINSAKISSTVAEGMGFAIPINDAVPVINELIENGYVTGRPSIGISCTDIDETAAAFYRVPTGAYVAAIAENSGAANSDLRVGDIITAINGTEVTSTSALNNVKNQLEPGDTVELSVYRMATGENSYSERGIDGNRSRNPSGTPATTRTTTAATGATTTG